MQCEAIVPEETRPTHSEMVEQPDGTYERVIHTETIPEHPCEAEATILARSMEERASDLDDVHWVPTEDHVYCPAHYVAGTMRHFDGRETAHAAMSVEDYQGGG